MDQDAFPIHPSASLLQDQSELLHYIGSATPTNRVIQAQRVAGDLVELREQDLHAGP